MTFIVIDHSYALSRRVVCTENGKFRYNDGVVFLDGSDNPLPNNRISKPVVQKWSFTEKWSAPDNKKAVDLDTTGLCQECYDDLAFDDKSLVVGEHGTTCFVCNTVVASGVSTLISADDAVEDLLDEYLLYIEQGHDEYAELLISDVINSGVLEDFYFLIQARPSLLQDSLIVKHMNRMSLALDQMIYDTIEGVL